MKNFSDSKFWISLIATLAALGILQLSENDQAALVQAVVTVIGAATYIVSVAIAQTKRDEPDEAATRGFLLDGWQKMSVQQAEAHKAGMQDYGVTSYRVAEELWTEIGNLTERIEKLEGSHD